VLRRRMSAEGGLLGRIRSIVGGRDGAVVDSISSAIGKRQLVLLIDEAGLLKDEEVASLLATIKDRCSSAIVSTSIEPLSSYRVYKGSFREGRVARELQFPLPRHSELGEMVKERIEGMGGRNIYPFTSEAVEYISRISGSIPREVLINCQNAAIYYADEKFDRELTRADLEILMTGKSAPGEREENLERVFANLSENQQKIIQSLVRPKTAHELEKELKISYGSLTKELGRLMLQTDTDMMGRKGLANPVCTKTDARPFKFVLTKKWRLLFTKE